MAAGLGVMRLFIIFVLGCLCRRLHCVQLDDWPDQADIQEKQQLERLLQRIRLERHFETIVVYGRAPCVFHELLPHLELPTVLLSNGSSLADWRFNSESTLLLCCGLTAEQEHNPRTLLQLQQARRLVQLEAKIRPQWLCALYFAREQHNVAMLDARGNLYSCRLYRQPNYVQLASSSYNSSSDSNSNSGSIYVQQYGNVQGAVIVSEPDQLVPRSMLYRDPSTGQLEMAGFVCNLMKTFVRRVNATLKLRPGIELGKTTYYGTMERRVQQNELDVAGTLASTLTSDNMDYLSYPFVSSSYCFMIPVPARLPYKKIYTMIVEPLVVGVLLLLFLIFSLLLIYSQELSWRRLSLSRVLLNDRCLRGLLGQPFPWPLAASRHLKAICLLLCFASLMTTTMYECYLQSFFTQPPAESMLRSYADFRASPYRIAVERREANRMLKSYNLTTDHSRNAFVLDDWHEFVHLRDTFNASFIYPVTHLRWKSYSEQQKLFKQPVFYYSEDVCLHRFLLMCLPVRRHWPYRRLFEQHTLSMWEFGVMQFWIRRAFSDMVNLNMTKLVDYSSSEPNEEAVYVRDLSWIFYFYATAHLLACLCFAVELCWGRYF
ncbi:uncharacterized protein Ir52a [Drosophila montana]|uniref:uncharacterized protein Ir52a n=1 Tax=Drosophila montana TaxID=40370 RepID=UPI00313D1321